MDKENQGKIQQLEEEKAHYEEQLRRRTEEVEVLKREKARLEKSIRDKEACAASKRQWYEIVSFTEMGLIMSFLCIWLLALLIVFSAY